MKLPISLLSGSFLIASSAALSAQVLLLEDFESFAQGATSTVTSDQFTIQNGFNVRTDFWAVEGGGSDPAGTGNNGADLFDTNNTRGFGLRDLDDGNNPGGPNTITFDAIAGASGNLITFSFDLASNNSVYDDNGDSILVQFDYDYDGISFDVNETYALTGTDNLGDGITTSTASSFTTFSYDLVGSVAGNLGLRISAIGMFDGSDQVTFDNITITAAPIPEPSTYALIGGVRALGMVVLHRRRS